MKVQRIAAVIACAALPAGLAACGSDSGTKFEQKSFKITEKDTHDFGFSDVAPKAKFGRQGPERLSRGDVLSFRSDLLRGGKDVGDLIASCTITGAGTFENADGECTGVYQLPEGLLTAQVGGVDFFAAKETAGAITGGTKDYDGASGTFTSPNSEDSTTVTTITIRVPKD